MGQIKIKVEGYNREHRLQLYSNYPQAYRKIYPKLNQVNSYSFEDFKTYSVFRHQQNNPNWRSYKKLSLKAFKWMAESDYFNYNNFDLTAKSYLNSPNDVRESLGVAGALTVASDFYGFTQADWQSIPIPARGSGRDFDFKIAATDSHFVVVEAKGTIVQDNTLSSCASSAMSNIKRKKSDSQFQNKYSGDVCFGLITAADHSHTLKTWITDPEMPEMIWPPKKVKLLKRLTFYYHVLRTISPRSLLCISLGNRIKELEKIEEYEQLDELPLLGYNEKEIAVNDYFINTKTHALNGDKVGRVFIYQEDPYFIGLDVSILENLALMNFNRILQYKSPPLTSERNMEIVVKKESKESKTLGSDFEERYNNRVVYKRPITIVKNSAGLNFSKVNT